MEKRPSQCSTGLSQVKRLRGFTLMEMMITMALAGVLVAVAVPNLRMFIWNNRLSSGINDMLHSFQVARTEAIKRGQNVVVCGAVDANAANPTCSFGVGVSSGWIVFVDANNDWQANNNAAELILERHAGLDPSINIRGDGNAIQSYNQTGFSNPAGVRVPTRNVVMCDSRVSELKADVDAALLAMATTCP
jgi:type IV fimbrial biogenesis protein FimT